MKVDSEGMMPRVRIPHLSGARTFLSAFAWRATRKPTGGQECPMPLGFDPHHPGGMADNSPTFQPKNGSSTKDEHRWTQICSLLPRPRDKRHRAPPHPSPLPFGRGEGAASAALGIVYAADSSEYCALSIAGPEVCPGATGRHFPSYFKNSCSSGRNLSLKQLNLKP